MERIDAALAGADLFVSIGTSGAVYPAAIRDTLAGEGYRVLDGEKNPYAEIWLRKATPASEKPAGPKGPDFASAQRSRERASRAPHK